jgi:hypothetical protein
MKESFREMGEKTDDFVRSTRRSVLLSNWIDAMKYGAVGGVFTTIFVVILNWLEVL